MDSAAPKNIARKRSRWRWTCRILPALVVLATALVWVVWRLTSDENVRQMVEEHLQRHFRGRVVVQHAHLTLPGRLELRGVSIGAASGRADDPVVFAAESLDADINLSSFVFGGPLLRRAEAVRPTVNWIWEAEGRPAPLSDLLNGGADSPAAEGALPEIRLTSVRLTRWARSGDGRVTPAGETPAIDLELGPDETDARFLRFRVCCPRLPLQPAINGRVSAEPFRIEAAGGPIRLCPEMAACLPPDFRCWWDRLGPNAEFEKLEATFDPRAGGLACRGTIRGARVLLPAYLLRPRLAGEPPPAFHRDRPAPDYAELTEVGGDVVYGSEGFTLTDWTGRFNGTAFSFGLRVDHPGRPDGRFAFNGAVRDLDLKPHVWPYRVLNENFDEVLEMVSPTGLVNLTMQVTGGLKPICGTGAADPLRVSGRAEMRNASLRARDFPYLIERISGTLDFDNDGGRLDLHGANGTGEIDIAGDMKFAGYRYSALDLLVRGRHNPLNDELAEAIPAFARHFYTDWNLEGCADADVRIIRPAGNSSDVSVHIIVTADGRASYQSKELPLRVHGVRGIVEVSGGGLESAGGQVYNLVGNANGGTVILDGRAGITSYGKPRMWAEFRTIDLPLDDDFGAALPEKEFRDAYRSFRPSGRVALAARLAKGFDRRVWPVPSATRVKYEIGAEVAGGGVLFDGFRFPVTDITGTLKMTRERFEVVEASGRHGRTALSAAGAVWSGDTDQIDLTLKARDLELDADLREALDAAQRQRWDSLEPAGAVDLSAHLVGDLNREDGVRTDLDIRPRGASVKPRAFPYRVSDLRGNISVRQDAVRLTGVTGKHGKAEIALAGSIGCEGGGAVDLTFSAAGLELDADIRDALPARPRRNWDLLKPSGVVDVKGRITGESGPAGGEASLKPDLEITARGLSLLPADLPYRFTDLRGGIRVLPDEIRLARISARHGNSEWTASGSRRDGPDGRTFTEATISARKLTIDDEFRAAVPDRIREGLKSMDPQGTFGFDLHLAASSKGGKAASWQFDGKVEMAAGSLDIGRRVDGIDGVLRARGEWLADGERWLMDGDFAAAKARFRELDLADVTGRISKAADSDTVIVSDGAGKTCGGQFSGSAQMSAGPQGRYSFRLNADRIDLYDFWKGFTGKPAGVSGTFDARISARGSRKGRDDIEMAGEVACRRGKLGEPPPPGGAGAPPAADKSTFAFDEAGLRLRRRGDNWQFEDIIVAGSGVKLAGRGTVNARDELDMTFVIVPPKESIRIPFVGEIIRGISNELVQVRVAGTTSDPKIGRHNLDQVGQPLRELLKQDPLRSLRNALELPEPK